MSKLAPENKFIDLSDYGRFLARIFAKSLVKTPFTPVHVTLLFFIVGLAAIYCILNQFYITALFLLILKSIIDAADGELARLRQKPSYIGRFLDSNLDFVLNFGFLYAIHIVTENSFGLMLMAFFSIQLQGTVFNYYYTILRNNSDGGDTTSRIKESSFPKALHGENQQIVNILFIIYTIFYGGYDKIIFAMDSRAKNKSSFPNWFMTFVSIYGLGFQLLIIGVMLTLGLINFISEFLVIYNVFILLLIWLRKIVLPQTKSSQ